LLFCWPAAANQAGPARPPQKTLVLVGFPAGLLLPALLGLQNHLKKRLDWLAFLLAC